MDEETRRYLDGLRSDIMGRIDRLQNDVTAIRFEMAVNFGTAADVRKANEHTREEVRGLHDIVSAMQRQIERLQAAVREIRGDP